LGSRKALTEKGKGRVEGGGKLSGLKILVGVGVEGVKRKVA